jgi:hypothetical protein
MECWVVKIRNIGCNDSKLKGEKQLVTSGCAFYAL